LLENFDYPRLDANEKQLYYQSLESLKKINEDPGPYKIRVIEQIQTNLARRCTNGDPPDTPSLRETYDEKVGNI
jgi:hypothetical protein